MGDSKPVERWRPIVGLEGRYEVSDLGRVWYLQAQVPHGRWPGHTRTIKGHFLHVRPESGRVGYATVSLCEYGGARYRSHRIHILVARAFLGPAPDGMEVRHLDGNPMNAGLRNLAYGTREENAQDTLRHGHNENATATACGRGHDLFAPNLVPSLLRINGSRSCLACSRARARWHRAKRKGVALPDLARTADAYYAEIMRDAA